MHQIKTNSIVAQKLLAAIQMRGKQIKVNQGADSKFLEIFYSLDGDLYQVVCFDKKPVTIRGESKQLYIL